MTPSELGLVLHHQGFQTRLKWHRLRRHAGDPLFAPDVMADGFKLGASMEIDLRVRADGGFAVLHDEVLEGETTGRGPVRETLAGEFHRLTMLDGANPVMLSETLAGLIADAHPDALLQFDMKDDLDRIGERGIDHLRDHFSGSFSRLIASGSDLPLIIALRQCMPDLKRGIDPTDKLVEIQHQDGWAAVERELVVDLAGPTEPDTIYLSWQLLLHAAQSGLDLIGLCHGHGKVVDAWTYNLQTPEAGFSDGEWAEFSALMALRPDQVTTDRAPAMERAWLQRSGSVAP
jgi:glycerophosphoryl diester phosphodiesterase